MSDFHDDMGRGNLRKIWWLITITLAMLIWCIASYVLYRAWYVDELPVPRTLFNPFTNLANLLLSLLVAWLIMLPIRPRGDL